VTSKDTKEADKRAKIEIEYLVREVTVNDGYVFPKCSRSYFS